MTAPALSGFELMVNALVAKGFARERALSEVARQYPELVPTLDEPRSGQIGRADLILERKEQTEIYKLFRGYRFKVMNLSQARASKQAPGLGDAWIVHRELPIAFWWESKRQVGGELSDAQIEMRDDSWRCGVRYYHGDRYAAAKLIVEFGLAEAGNGPCGIVPINAAGASSSGT